MTVAVLRDDLAWAEAIGAHAPDEVDSDLYTDARLLASRAAAADAGPTRDLAPALLGREGAPVALLFRQVASPNYELLSFVRKARRHGFEPVVVEHSTDRFSVHNPSKRALATLPVVVGLDCRGRAILRRHKLVEHNSADCRPLDAILLPSGESLTGFHRRRLGELLGPAAPRRVELRELVPRAADGAAAYYHDVFRLLSGRVVLFEDFVTDAQTARFFDRTVRPAYGQALRDMGQRPQIARLMNGRRASSPLWNAYPPAMAAPPDRGRPALAAPCG